MTSDASVPRPALPIPDRQHAGLTTADISLFVDESEVGSARLERTTPIVFSGDEGMDIGTDTGSPVTDEYEGRARYPGTPQRVRPDADKDDHSHLIATEQRFHPIMSRR